MSYEDEDGSVYKIDVVGGLMEKFQYEKSNHLFRLLGKDYDGKEWMYEFNVDDMKELK